MYLSHLCYHQSLLYATLHIYISLHFRLLLNKHCRSTQVQNKQKNKTRTLKSLLHQLRTDSFRYEGYYHNRLYHIQCQMFINDFLLSVRLFRTQTLAILRLIHPVKENVHPQRLKKARNSPYKAAQSQVLPTTSLQSDNLSNSLLYRFFLTNSLFYSICVDTLNDSERVGDAPAATPAIFCIHVIISAIYHHYIVPLALLPILLLSKIVM